MQASDGKFYETDVADLQTIFRLIQSIPSKKGEPKPQIPIRIGYRFIKTSGQFSQVLAKTKI